MNFQRKLVLAVAAFGLTLGVAGTPLMAQIGTSETQAPATAVPEPKIDAFSDAFVRANKVIEQWEPRVEAAPQDQQAQLIQQANGEIATAIESKGDITVQEYQQIIIALQSDPGLAERVDGELRERLGPSPN